MATFAHVLKTLPMAQDLKFRTRLNQITFFLGFEDIQVILEFGKLCSFNFKAQGKIINFKIVQKESKS